ncbi:MAG: hypothetical protein WC951_05755 [Bacteroidales bacterium]
MKPFKVQINRSDFGGSSKIISLWRNIYNDQQLIAGLKKTEFIALNKKTAILYKIIAV